jgi:hypothetical protein
MALKEKARQSGPIPNAVPGQGSAEFAPKPIILQVSALTRRCAISAAMAETIAPLAFGGVS